MNTNINKNVVEGITELLADSYVLQVMTQNCHWNIKGPHFSQYHIMFEEQYNEISTAIDEIAEHIRAFDVETIGSMQEFIKHSNIPEITEKNLSATAMLKNLINAHEHIISTIRQLYPIVESNNDEASADLLAQRERSHLKTRWMLRATLSE